MKSFSCWKQVPFSWRSTEGKMVLSGRKTSSLTCSKVRLPIHSPAAVSSIAAITSTCFSFAQVKRNVQHYAQLMQWHYYCWCRNIHHYHHVSDDLHFAVSESSVFAWVWNICGVCVLSYTSVSLLLLEQQQICILDNSFQLFTIVQC